MIKAHKSYGRTLTGINNNEWNPYYPATELRYERLSHLPQVMKKDYGRAWNEFWLCKPCPNCSITFLPSILVVIYKGLWFQQAQLGSSEYLFVEELGFMRKKMGKFPFYSLISLLQRKYVSLYSFLLSGFYSEWSVKGTWIPKSTFFIYLFLKN